MRDLRLLLWIVVWAIMAACSSNNNDDETEDETQAFFQMVTLPAEHADTLVTLDNLNAAISDVQQPDADWLTINIQDYVSGDPCVQLIAQDNNEDEQRRCLVSFIAVTGDKVLLSVSQAGQEQDVGLDDRHDLMTDKPAL